MEMTGLWKAWKAKDASPSSHEPLGNLANSRRDSPGSSYHFKQKHRRRRGFAPTPGGRRSAPLKSKE